MDAHGRRRRKSELREARRLDRLLRVVKGGEIFREHEGEKQYRIQLEVYELDLGTLVWRRTTSRNWRQFEISPEPRNFFNSQIDEETLFPDSAEYRVLSRGVRKTRIEVDGVPILVRSRFPGFRIVVEGDLPEELARRIAEKARANAERASGFRCLLS